MMTGKTELEAINATLLDALQTILNLEGAAFHAAHTIPVFYGLDVDYHCDKARAAITRGTKDGGKTND